MTPGSADRSPDASDPQAARLRVARIGKPHGVRGEVTVQLFTDDPLDRLGPGARLHLSEDSGAGASDRVPAWSPGTEPTADAVLHVRTQRWNKSICMLTFAEVADRTTAEELRNAMLFAEMPQPDEDEYYSHDLEGFSCVDTEGRALGTVEELIPGAAQDLLAVRPTGGEVILVPFVEELVPEIDSVARRIVLSPPDGLF